MNILVLEASTASAKAMLYNASTGVERVVVKQYEPLISKDGMQDADAVYELLLDVGAQAAKDCDVAAISLGGVWHSLVVCDEQDRPKLKAQTWEYLGAVPTARRIRQDTLLTHELYNRTGCMVHAIYPAYKLMRLKEEGFDLSDCHIFTHGSYQFYRLTGERQTTACMESGGGLLNTHGLDYDEKILELCGLKKSQLPALVTYRQTQPLCAAAAARLGVQAGIPVVPPHADGALNQVGAGGLRPGVMTLSVGTSAAIRMAFDEPFIPDVPGTWCYVAPEKWLCGAATSGATNCVDWFVKGLNRGALSYQELEKSIAHPEVAPIFLPFLFGERCPGWNDERQGGFAGINALCAMGELYYAVLEGVLFNILQCYLTLTAVRGTPQIIRASGGVCKSPFWSQMLADILGQPIALSDNEQTSLMGGAVLGMHAVGAIQDLGEYTVLDEKLVQPDHRKKEHYAARFERYLEAYASCSTN